MAFYFIGFPHPDANAASEIIQSLLTYDAVEFWSGAWFVEMPDHPERCVQGLFVARAFVMEFDARTAAFFGGPVAAQARLFVAEKLGPAMVASRPEAERQLSVHYCGEGERVFSDAVERYRQADPDGSRTTPLCRIMMQRGSDKGVGWHNYTTFYAQLFADRIDSTHVVFEVGLGTNNTDVTSNMGEAGVPGASLRGWRDFFPAAAIYGADIDRRILFQDDRIRTFFVDQTLPASFASLWRELPELGIDLFIDDGLHTFEAARTTFEESVRRMRPGGLYIIEDVWARHADAYLDLLTERGYSGLFLKLPHPLNIHDNGLIVAQT